MIIECWRELHVFCPLWHHQFLQITLSCLDTEIFLEWFGIIAVITQLPGCLHIKRGCGIIIGEILRLTHVDPVIKHRLVICLSCRNLVDVFSPLPESKGVFEYRVIKNLCQRSIEYIFLIIAIFLEHWQQRSLSLEEEQLEIEHLLSVFLG